MANVIDRIAIEAAEPPAEPAPPASPVRFRGLKRLWNGYCDSQPCVQNFYAELEAEARARAAQDGATRLD